MRNYEIFYGLAVFVVTCLLVKSHPDAVNGGQRRGSHVYQSLRRPLSAALATEDDDDAQTPAVMWGALLLTAVITTVLVLALALCTCGKKSNNKSTSQESEITPDENPEVTQQPVGNGPSSPVVVTGDTPPQPPQTPSPEVAVRGASFSPGSPNGGALLTSPPSPNFCDMSDILYADASPTASPSHAPTRGATINRQLPQLPQTVVTDGDEKDQDYDGTYDVIPEKRKDTPIDDYDKGGGYERLRDTKAKGPLMPPDPKEDPYAKVNESRKRKASLEELTDPNYNSIEETRGAVAGSPPKAGIEVDSDLDADGHYASVEGRKKDAPYARVKDRDEIDRSNGYCRVREVQNMPTSPAAERSAVAITTRVSPVANRRTVQDEDEQPPAVPEKLPDLENGMDVCMSPASQSHQRLPSIGSMGSGGSGISIGLVERTSPVPPASPQLSNNQASLAASIAAGTAAAAAGDFTDQATQPTNMPVREKPYTQVSARESLEFVRARQQAEHTALTAHYELVNENENDYDGIYETVNEGQMSPQPEPPPLPHNRQLQSHYELVNENENDYDGIYETVNEGQMSPQLEPPPLPHNRQLQAPAARLAVYEEINDNDRHQNAPAAVVEVEDDEMQPYASTHNPTAANRQAYGPPQSPNTANRQPYASAQSPGPATRQAYPSSPNPSPAAHRQGSLPAQRNAPSMSPVYAQVDKDKRGSVKNSDLYTEVKRTPGSSVRAGANHDTRQNGAQSPPEPPAMLSNQQGDNFEDLYSKVQKQPSLDGMPRMNGSQRQNGMDMIVHSSPEGAAPDSSYQSIDECLNDDDVGNRARAAGLVHTSQIKPSVSNKQRKPKEHTYQAVDDNKNAKKSRKEKKEKKNKKDQPINRTPSPQPNNNPPVWQRREIPPHSGYEDVNVNNAPILHTSVNDNANRLPRSRTNSQEQGKLNGYGNQDVRIRANSGNPDTRIRANSREQIGVNGIAPPGYTKQGNRSRANSHEYSGMNGGVLPQVTKRFSGPIENGNNNCAHHPTDFFLGGFAQETRL